MRPDQHLLVNLSGRGDKDIGTVADLSGAEFYCRPSCRGQTVEGRAQPTAEVSRDEPHRSHPGRTEGAGPHRR